MGCFDSVVHDVTAWVHVKRLDLMTDLDMNLILLQASLCMINLKNSFKNECIIYFGFVAGYEIYCDLLKKRIIGNPCFLCQSSDPYFYISYL